MGWNDARGGWLGKFEIGLTWTGGGGVEYKAWLMLFVGKPLKVDADWLEGGGWSIINLYFNWRALNSSNDISSSGWIIFDVELELDTVDAGLDMTAPEDRVPVDKLPGNGLKSAPTIVELELSPLEPLTEGNKGLFGTNPTAKLGWTLIKVWGLIIGEGEDIAAP